MLTDSAVRGAKPRSKPYTVADATGQRGTGRLVMRVMPTGSKQWIYTYYVCGRRKKLGLGSYPSTPLSAARRQAQELAGQLQQGSDPAAQRAAEREAAAARYGSFAALLDDYLEAKPRASDSIARSLESYVRGPFPALLDREARSITPEDIRAVLARMLRLGVTTHANRVRAYLSAAFTHGLRADHDPARSGSARYGLQGNPVAAVPSQPQFEKAGDRWLDEAEVRHVWLGVDDVASPTVAVLVKLALVTGARPGELIRLRWSDWASPDLTIPAEVSKNHLPLVLPLPRLGVRLVERLEVDTGGQDYLFASRRGNVWTGCPITPPSLARAVSQVAAELGMDSFTPRDLRRTWKTLAGRAGLPKSIRDRIQNHALGDVSAKHYDRHDYYAEKRAALVVWESWLAGLLADKDVRLRRVS
jgi:integrase